MDTVAENKCFGGRQIKVKHASSSTQCDMTFSIFLPSQAQTRAVPALFWLSGLTCTDDNFVTKAGAQRCAAELGIAIVCPDTSPRGEDVADDKDGAYDFGLGAGFYVNATVSPFAQHYNMYTYIASELPELVATHFPVDITNLSISGHSMGGHGALTIGLKHPERYKSISAFSPICSPMNCPWGQKAFSGYLGEDRDSWAQYDACELIKRAEVPVPILVDQGQADDFLEAQLKPHLLQQASECSAAELELRLHEGYDHSYFFISSFIEQHLRFHAKYLRNR